MAKSTSKSKLSRRRSPRNAKQYPPRRCSLPGISGRHAQPDRCGPNAGGTRGEPRAGDVVLGYWPIDTEEQENNGWGDGVVEQLSKDLGKRYPGTFGFSTRNLWDMRRFYENWSRRAIMRQAVAELGTPLGTVRGKVQAKREKPLPTRLPGQIAFMRQAVAELPWGHHLVLLNKLDDVSDRIWYMRQAVELGWSRNILLNQILAQAHKRIVKEA